MRMGIGFEGAGRWGLALGLVALVSACGAADGDYSDDDYSDSDSLDDEAVDTAQSSMAKGPISGGKCHVKHGPYVIVGSGTYSSKGECCGMTRCTNDCDGQKYVQVCISCNAAVDVKCEDGHHPVALVRGGTLKSTLKAVRR